METSNDSAVAGSWCRDDTEEVLPRAAFYEGHQNAEIYARMKIKNVIAWVLGFSYKNILVSSEVLRHAARVSVIATVDLTPKQAMQLFVASLRLHLDARPARSHTLA
jgi:hypothetical protein